MAPYNSSGVIQVSESPKIPKWFEKTLITLFYKAENTKLSWKP